MSGMKASRNGFVPTVNNGHMYRMQLVVLVLCMLLFLSCKETTTPKEFQFTVETPFNVYKQDVLILQDLLLTRSDSIHKVAEEDGKQRSKYIKSEIDTIFYGPSNKIGLLVISTRENKYVAKVQSNSEGIDYVGECFIGIKENDSYLILKSLKYSTTSYQSFDRVVNSLREMYLKEMNYIKGRYNINDSRFWESSVW